MKRLAWGLACLLSIDCASATGAHAPTCRATVAVENRYWNDVRVYASNGGHPIRLGSVTAQSTEILTLPAHMAGRGQVRFILHPLAEDRYALPYTDPVGRCGKVELNIGHGLQFSSVSVW